MHADVGVDVQNVHKVEITAAKDNDSLSNIHNNDLFHHSGTSMHWSLHS